MKRTLLMLCLLFMACIGCNAQMKVLVNKANGNVDTYPFNESTKITFNDGNINFSSPSTTKVYSPRDIGGVTFATEIWGDYQPLSWNYTRVVNQWQTNRQTREEELRLYADLTSPNTAYIYNIPAKAMSNFDFNNCLTFVGSAKEFTGVKNGSIVPTDGHFRFIQHPVTDARSYEVYETDGRISRYELTVSNDGSKLYAAKPSSSAVVIATITPAGVISLTNNSVSQLLLNAYDKSELAYGQTLCARVGFEASCSEGEVKVIDGDFDVRFIKPLSAATNTAEIADANDMNIMGAILSNIVCFNGYTFAERPD